VNEFFSIYLILPTALGPGVHSASNRNEYQKQKNHVSGMWSLGFIRQPDVLLAFCTPDAKPPPSPPPKKTCVITGCRTPSVPEHFLRQQYFPEWLPFLHSLSSNRQKNLCAFSSCLPSRLSSWWFPKFSGYNCPLFQSVKTLNNQLPCHWTVEFLFISPEYIVVSFSFIPLNLRYQCRQTFCLHNRVALQTLLESTYHGGRMFMLCSILTHWRT
jgi:hypothetical protein